MTNLIMSEKLEAGETLNDFSPCVIGRDGKVYNCSGDNSYPRKEMKEFTNAPSTKLMKELSRRMRRYLYLGDV